MSKSDPKTTLGRVYRLRLDVGPDAASKRCQWLEEVEKSQLPSAADVKRLHGLACFMRAFPSDRASFDTAKRILEEFATRSDLLRHREGLADTGIAGTTVHYSFYWQTAKWLYQRWPDALSIDWGGFEKQHDLDGLWSLLLSFPATEALDHISLAPEEWIKTLKRPEETDAAFLIRHFLRWQVDEAVREKTWDDLDVPMILSPANGSPSTTHSVLQAPKIHYNDNSPGGNEPFLQLLRQRPRGDRYTASGNGRKLVDLGRSQMITRGRDLFAFMHADPGDVHILDYERGLQFVGYGLQPLHRCLLETMYVFLILKNGVPIGYTQATALLRSAEINFNIFEDFRGTETTRIFGTTLAMVRHLFDIDTFVINTQQLGEDNTEALKTGAFWFYYKHGFRPRDDRVKRLAQTESRRKKDRQGYRSDLATLKKLATADLYLSLGRPRVNVVSTFPTGTIALATARSLEHNVRDPDDAVRQAAHLLQYHRRMTPSEKIAWERWGPLVLALPGINRWSSKNKTGLAEVITAKGARRELGFVALFDKHRALQNSMLKLAANSPFD